MTRVRWRLWLLMIWVLTAAMPGPAGAVQPDEILPDATLEHRARVISGGLRCLVCQNQSIDDSDALLAKDLRVLVRERLKAGDSDTAAISYIVARYGDFVLLKPPLKPGTALLWLAPLLLLLGGAWMGLRAIRATRPDEAAGMPLSDAERQRLNSILNGKS